MAVSLVKVIAPAGRPHKSSALTGRALSKYEKGCFIMCLRFEGARIACLRALLTRCGQPANCAFVSTPVSRIELDSVAVVASQWHSCGDRYAPLAFASVIAGGNWWSYCTPRGSLSIADASE